jgi:hypothetical protein
MVQRGRFVNRKSISAIHGDDCLIRGLQVAQLRCRDWLPADDR